MNIQENTAIFSLGPGAPDDSIAIQNAANAFPAVYLRAGTYNCKSKIAISNKTRLYAEKGARLLYANLTGSYNLIETTAEVTLDGLELDGNQANVTNAITGDTDDKQGLVVLKDGSSNSKVLNCYIHDSWGAGVWGEPIAGDNMVNIEIASNHFKNNGYAVHQQTNPIYMFRNASGSTSFTHIHDNFIENQRGLYGIYSHFDTDSNIRHNIINSNVAYTNANPVVGIIADDAVKHTQISKNKIQGVNMGIEVDWTITQDCVVEGNICNLTTNGGAVLNQPGIYITNTGSGAPIMSRMIVANNIITGCGGQGILIQASRVICSGNLIYDTNQNASFLSTNRGAISIYNSDTQLMQDIIVANNLCYDTGGNLQLYGITVANQAGGTVQDVFITGNDVQHNATAGILVSSGTNIQARQNPGYNPQGFATTTPAVPASTIDQTNTNPYPVRIYFLTSGTVTVLKITDPSGTSQSITTALSSLDTEISLDPGAKIALTYSAAPTWKWYGT